MEEIRIIAKGAGLLKIGPKAFKDFIAPFVKEKSYLAVQKVPTLAQERRWLQNLAKRADERKSLFVFLFSDGKLVGNCNARIGEYAAERGNASFGLAMSKPYRGKGWGEKLLRRAIREAKARFKPHRLWIEHASGNTPARRLYQKVGFVEVGRLSEYHNHHGEWKDKILMQYKPARKTNSSRKR